MKRVKSITAELTKQVNDLRRMLFIYGGHTYSCPAQNPPAVCRCGFSEVWAKYELQKITQGK